MVIPARLATALTMSWAARVFTGNSFSSAKWCSKMPGRGGHRHHADLALLTVKAALALETELCCCQRTFFGVRSVKLADAEPITRWGNGPIPGRVGTLVSQDALAGVESRKHCSRR